MSNTDGPIRPAPPSRTLSSSLRQYRHSAFFRSRLNGSGQDGSSQSTPALVDPANSITEEPPLSNKLYGTNGSLPSNLRSSAIYRGHGPATQSTPLLEAHRSSGSSFAIEDSEFNTDDEEAQESPQADADGLYPPNCTWTSDTAIPAKADPFGNRFCNVWRRLHEVRKDIMHAIDDPYSLQQLKAPRMNISVVRPLVDKYFNMNDLCIVYCLLTNRIQFIREQSYATHHQTLNLTRALLCELLAERVLRRYNEYNPGPLGLLKLANILVAGFEPFQGAPQELLQHETHAERRSRGKSMFRYESTMTALEIAIVSESKSFLASTACQRVVDAIYRGKIVYSPSSFVDIIPDHWKRRPISLYDPRRGPMLNQYRLIVPRTRNMIEVVQFLVLLILYIIVMTGRETWKTTKYDAMEAVFDLYAAGWVLDQIASIFEHGWSVYTQNLWSFLDVFFSLIFLSYLSLRMHGLRCDSEEEDMRYGRMALDILSCAAPILVPRLAFNVMSDNMLILSLRSMMSDFLTLTGLAIWCFGGFLFSLKWLHDGIHKPFTIVKWMIWIWFGLDGTGIDRADEFHWFLGPSLMIIFAFLGNTLFLTILVSMLSNTFSVITANAVQEIQYRRAVLTFMGVKSDAIFAYMPPFNLFALFFLLPLKWIISARLFHKLNVVIAKTMNFPLLLLISTWERRSLWVPERMRFYRPRKINWVDPNGPRATGAAWWSRAFQFWDFSQFSAHGDIQAVFDLEPPQSWIDTDQEDPHDVTRKVSVIDDPSESVPAVDGEASQRPELKSAQSHASRKSKKDVIKEQALRKEFFDSEDDIQNKDDHPTGYSKLRKKTRKDSMIDFDHPFGTSHETNARLLKLEGNLEKIEALLMRLIDNGNEDENQTQEELRSEVEAERH